MQQKERTQRVRNDGRAGVADDATLQVVRNGLISMLVAALVLLVFNSGGLRTWARGFPGNAVTDVLVASADQWHAMMQRAGVATGMAAVRDAVAELRDQPWPEIISADAADLSKHN